MIRLPVAVAMFFAICHLGAGAAIVVDQQQLDAFAAHGPDNGSFQNVQSFVPSVNNIVGASVAIQNVTVGSTITIRIFDMFGDVSNPTLAIASGSVVTTSNAGTISQFETVDFGSTLAITPSQTYYLSFEKSIGSGGAFMGADGDSYVPGQLFSGGTGFDLDFAFQTFTDNSVSAVPEPSSILVLGFVGACAVTRRRRR